MADEANDYNGSSRLGQTLSYLPQLKFTQNNGQLVECWNDGELEYRIIFTHRVSPYHHSNTPILQVSSGKLAYYPIPNS
jgi:hypothetical protein